MQPDPTTMECGHHGMWPNQSLQSQGNAPIETEPMIKNTTHSSIGCNGMANDDDYHGLEMYKNHECKGLNHRGIYATRPNQHGMHVAESIRERSRQHS